MGAKVSILGSVLSHLRPSPVEVAEEKRRTPEQAQHDSVYGLCSCPNLLGRTPLALKGRPQVQTKQLH